MSKQRKQERREPQERNTWQGSNEQGESADWELESNLEPGMLRFLAHVIEDGLQTRMRTQEDFIRHFPPVDIMIGLTDRPDLRANILVPTTGVRPKIAAKKAAESAGQDLQIALDEGETDAGVIVSLFHPDDRARYLDRARLWNYIIEPKFWTHRKGSGEFDQAKSHVAFILDRAIEDRMVTVRDIVDGIGIGAMVEHMPLDQLKAIIEGALAKGRENKAFTEKDLLNMVPTKALLDHIPLSVIWEQVICPKLAEQNDFVATTNPQASAARPTSAVSPPPTYASEPAEEELNLSDAPGISNEAVENTIAHAETY